MCETRNRWSSRALHLDWNVLAHKEPSSAPTAFGFNETNQATAFATTHWSVLAAAQGSSRAAEEALERLCRTYWKPLYTFVRRQGWGPEEAQDLTQSFFARLLERRDLAAARKEKGRLRSYLLISLKRFLFNARDRALALKRGAGERPVPLEEIGDGRGRAGSEKTTAELIYERRWALTVLEQVLARLREEYEAAGNGQLFGWLHEILIDDPGKLSQARIAAELGMTENAVRQAFHRLRLRYREILREEISRTVMLPGDVEDELRHLITVLRA
ncbi:MAG TPA: sigma-70 family RNA polymerase sigma factor [Chthoniobacterales bacterium]|jgi:RNA polymerase sigma-70 factor (ECF subfamily)|nr:sigma-70 family RNA polymerase sigma factor [Chthoniobacterales bacterium]